MTHHINRLQLAISVAGLAIFLAACTGGPPQGNSKELNVREIAAGDEAQASKPLTAEIWVDNWFAMFVNGKPLIEDSTPYKTERSFNAERVSFSAAMPATFAFEFRDFMENDTGLEYIGTRRQQMGDGGAIVQVKDPATGAIVAASGADWRCLVIHQAPLDQACTREENPELGKGRCEARISSPPANWTSPDFDDSQWPKATVFSESAVRPKDGYDRVSWSSSAKLIWGPDLQKDNIVLCRIKVG